MLNAPVGEGGVDGNQSDGKKGKRELSTSKRAAQNRAAQVSAFSVHVEKLFYFERKVKMIVQFGLSWPLNVICY